MAPGTDSPSAADIRSAADEIAARYGAASIEETEATLAVLALWALDAVASGRLPREEADRIFFRLDERIGTAPGAELSDEARDLLFDGMTFHDWGERFGPDPDEVRRLALQILGRTRATLG